MCIRDSFKSFSYQFYVCIPIVKYTVGAVSYTHLDVYKRQSINSNQSPDFVIFKVRTLNDEIINTKKGNGRVKLKGDTFLTYKEIVKVLNSYEYQNKIINRETAKQKFVDFILGLVVSNYKIN